MQLPFLISISMDVAYVLEMLKLAMHLHSGADVCTVVEMFSRVDFTLLAVTNRKL